MTKEVTDISEGYSIKYSLNNQELKKLIDLLSSSDNSYDAFLIAFLKEVEGDVNKILRIISTGIHAKRKVFNLAMANYFVGCIKKAIILSNYKKFIEEDGFISLYKMSNTERFKVAEIDRQTIIRVLKKYGIHYNKKK
jgi:hypothetical protein